MLVRLVFLATAAALVLAYAREAEGSHPFQGSVQLNINYLHRDFELGGDGQIFYRLCDNAGRGVPAEWGAGVEKWDLLLGPRFAFDPVTSCSDTKTGATKLRWEVGAECSSGALACWRTWAFPDHFTPHASHSDILLGLIIFDPVKWDQVPAWRSYMPSHELGHDLSLADHVSHDCAENTLMLNYLAGHFPSSPCGADPTATDIASVLCNVYHRCGDFSGDSCTDVLVREPLWPPPPPPSKDLKIVRGNCGGAFSDQTAVRIGTGWEPFDWLLRPGDFNGNSPNSNAGEACTDVIADETSIPYLARLYPGNCAQGGNYFKGGWTQIGSGWQAFSWVFAPGDFNGDNCSDVIFREGDVLSMVRGNCAGNFIDQTAFVISGTGWGAATWLLGPGDWDADGCADIIARFGSTLKLYQGNCGAGGQYFKTGLGISMGGGPTNWSNYTKLASVGDFAGNTCMDLFSRDSAGTLRVHYGNCSTGFTNGSGTPVGWGWNIFDYIY